MEAIFSFKTSVPSEVHGFATHKSALFTVTTARTSDPTMAMNDEVRVSIRFHTLQEANH
jgi:hypothetical protein